MISLAEIARARAQETPNRTAYKFLRDDGCTIDSHLTYGELYGRAVAFAQQIRDCTTPGDRALLVPDTGRDFVIAFMACQYAGIIAVPMSLPKGNANLERFQAIIEDAEPKVALCDGAPASRIGKVVRSQRPNLPVLAVDSPVAVPGWRELERTERGKIAFLQYTSGSTGSPKGVVVTHANLYHNHLAIERSFLHPPEKPSVGWLPLHHDMGLIGQVLEPMYLGIESILLSPAAFAQKPVRWLRAISKFRASTSGGPSFAYELCAQRITEDQLEELDLSSWTLAFCGSEPVSADTFERFAAKFGRCGFQRGAFYPCYGLAEATLFVAGGVKGTAPEIVAIDDPQAGSSNQWDSRPKRVVSCGRGWNDCDIRIVDPATSLPRAELELGEIWVSSRSVAPGYWGRGKLSSSTFGARLTGIAQKSFLRTGDIGFIRDGQLYVTGRLKDIIIIRGRNHFPHDIERTAERANAALKSFGCAVFTVIRDGEERLVIIQEVDRRWIRKMKSEEVIGDIQQAVVMDHNVSADDIVLVYPGEVPKTSSGKVRRKDCKARYAGGALRMLGSKRAASGLPGHFRTTALDWTSTSSARCR